MRVYVDSSVLLRRLFGEANGLAEWAEIDEAFASRVLRVEVGRVIDRARLAGAIDDAGVEALHRGLGEMLRSIALVELSEPILSRAAGPMPTVLGSLDALHLATALELARELDAPIPLATHDAQLARAARASGLAVIGA